MVTLLLLAILIRPDARTTPPVDQVRVYCASGVAAPINELVEAFNQQFGSHVEVVRTGGSGQLAGQIKAEHELGFSGADIYISADEDLVKAAQSESLIREATSIASQNPVIAVNVQDELEFDSLSDLIHRSDIRFGVAAKQSAIGRQTRQIADRDGLLERLEKLKTTDSENVMTLAQALVTGSLDAAIVWDTVVTQVNKPETLVGEQVQRAPKLKIAAALDDSGQFESHVMVGVLNSSKAQVEAAKFIGFLTTSKTSRHTFERFGFSVDSIPKESAAH